MIRKYIYCLFLILAPLFVSAQNTEKEQQKENSKNEGFSDFENFIKPYREKLEEISKQKPKIANPSSFTIEERNAYQNHFLLEKKAKNDIELAKFTFIEQNKNNEYTQVLITEKLNGIHEEVNFNLLATFYEGLNQNDKNSENGKKLDVFLKEYELVQIGAKVPDFSLPNTKKKQQNLYKNLGKYTIIYFWASWCVPCRKENPNTVAIFKKYKSKGLKIIAISLDIDEQQWINTIEEDHLSWLQLSNLNGWNEPLLQHFKVTSIPKAIVLDKKGNIIAKDLKGEDLSNKLDELFGKK